MERWKSYYVLTPAWFAEWVVQPTVPVPLAVRVVPGCNCGGRVLHRIECTLNLLPEVDALLAIEDSLDRIRDYLDWVSQ